MCLNGISHCLLPAAGHHTKGPPIQPASIRRDGACWVWPQAAFVACSLFKN